MFGSLSIGRIAGIAIRVHWTFLVLLGWLFWAWGAGRIGFSLPMLMVVVAGLLVAVLLHELGHSLVARHFGVHVLDITFWPLGGMARMADMPESPRIEGCVAVAGPLVNLALAGVSLCMYALSSNWTAHPVLGERSASLAYSFWALNLAMGLFNLVPAFPLDGGRILRAWLARGQDWPRATEQAVMCGRWTLLMGLLGVLVWRSDAWCSALLLALYVWFEGARELWAVRSRHGLMPFGGWAGRNGAGQPREPREPDLDPTRSMSAQPEPDQPEPGRGQARRPELWDLKRVQRGGNPEQLIEELERSRAPMRPQPPAPDDPS